MDYVEGRGICCGNEVYFDYVDGEVVMTMYRDMPGVRSDRLKPNVIKTFSIDQWGELNEYLRVTLNDVEGVFNDGDGSEEVEETLKGKDRKVSTARKVWEAQYTNSPKEVELPKVNVIPKMSNAEAILPENKVPVMTKDEIQEKLDPITGTQNEEDKKEENGTE